MALTADVHRGCYVRLDVPIGPDGLGPDAILQGASQITRQNQHSGTVLRVADSPRLLWPLE